MLRVRILIMDEERSCGVNQVHIAESEEEANKIFETYKAGAETYGYKVFKYVKEVE